MSKKIAKKKVMFYRVWRGTKPYITVKQERFDSTIASRLGFSTFEKKDFPPQYFKIAPKKDKDWSLLKKRLYKSGYVSRVIDADDDRVDKLGWKYFTGYEFGLKVNVTAGKLSKLLIKKEKAHASLIGCSVGHFFKSTKAPYDEETQRMTFAYATTANVMNEKFAHLDFMIFYYEDAWTACTNEEREILVDHELFHCAVDGTPYLRDHDIEEFKYIANKYGLKPPSYHWGTKALKSLLDEREREE